MPTLTMSAAAVIRGGTTSRGWLGWAESSWGRSAVLWPVEQRLEAQPPSVLLSAPAQRAWHSGQAQAGARAQDTVAQLAH